MITNAHYLEHANTMFDELVILKLADINKYISSVFMYKYENKDLPKCFVGTFTKIRKFTIIIPDLHITIDQSNINLTK